MNRQAILDRLNAEAPALKAKYAVKSLGPSSRSTRSTGGPALKAKYAVKSLAVFGSIARDDDHEKSDVDILVTFEGPATFDNFMGLKLDLEDLFGRRVDLLTPKCLRPAMRTEIDKEAILVP